MMDQIDTRAVVVLIVRVVLLAWIAVAGLTISLCATPPCLCRVLGAVVGMGCGSVLFTQMVCVQLARSLQAEMSHSGSLSS